VCKRCNEKNYDDPTSFFCQHCSKPRFVDFDPVFLCRPAFAIDKIKTEEDKAAAAKLLETQFNKAY